MATRFPGIDPYIEAQAYWRDFHMTFLLHLRRAILAHLPADYEARAEEQLITLEVDEEDQSRLFGPEITIARREKFTLASAPEPTAESASALLLESVEIPLPILAEETWRWLEIRKRPNRELVTVIELLSPSNKKGDGRDAYVAKRAKLLARKIHVIELDLLLAGRRLALGGPLPPGDFYVYVSRSNRRPYCDVFAWDRRSSLPKIPIPLKSPDPDLIIELAAIYTSTYDDAEFQRSVDYSEPLQGWNAVDRAWALEFT